MKLSLLQEFCLVLSNRNTVSTHNPSSLNKYVAGGEMPLSAKHRSHGSNTNPTNHPSSHDLLEQTEGRSASTEKQSIGRGDDSLVEHILDFLDKYPVRFMPQASLTGCMRAL